MDTLTKHLIVDSAEYLRDICHIRSANAGWWGHQELGDLRELINNPTNATDKLVADALVGQKLALIHSEVSEALEGYRKNKMDDHLPHRKSIEVELADALIRIMDLAGAMKLDIGGAIAEKLEYNAKRADHKPEARAAEGGKAF